MASDQTEGNMTAGEDRPGGVVASAVHGDRGALSALWASHRRWVAAVLLAHMPRGADLDDLLQEVALKVAGGLGSLKEEAAFKPWLRTVAVGVALDAGRRKTARGKSWWERVARNKAAERGDEPDPRSAVDRGVEGEGRRLLELARGLPEGYREPLLLKCVRGLSYRQIGEVMGLPETTIETRIARGRRMLRGLAEREAEGRAAQGSRVRAVETGTGGTGTSVGGVRESEMAR